MAQFRLPNAVAGSAYAQSPIALDGPSCIREIRGLEQTGGLIFDPDRGCVEGTPEHPGEFTFSCVADSGDGALQSGTVLLTVNPDPRSLWQTREPDPQTPFPKAHEDAAQRIHGETRLLFASGRGRAHAHAAAFRDDDGGIAVGDTGRAILAVADGAGSCPLSRRGSQVAVTRAIQTLNAADRPEESLIDAAREAVNAIHSEAASLDEAPHAFSTTLLLAVHHPTPAGHRIAAFQVGDGAIALYCRGQPVQLLGTPDTGIYAGQTRFLSAELFDDLSALNQRVQTVTVEAFTALILASDGVTDPFFETETALRDTAQWETFWQTIAAHTTDETSLLRWLDFQAVGSHDDRTIALLVASEIRHA